MIEGKSNGKLILPKRNENFVFSILPLMLKETSCVAFRREVYSLDGIIENFKDFKEVKSERAFWTCILK